MQPRTATEQRRTAALVPHPASPPSPIIAIEIDVVRTSLGMPVLDIHWRIRGDLARVELPPAKIGRTDGLWRSTCVEAFVGIEGQASYLELNASPTDGWATYSFDDYRQGAAPSVQPVAIERWREPDTLVVEAELDLDAVFERGQRGRTLRLGLSTVIQDTDGGISYWALAHPPGKPDFHHFTAFALTLPAPESA